MMPSIVGCKLSLSLCLTLACLAVVAVSCQQQQQQHQQEDDQQVARSRRSVTAAETNIANAKIKLGQADLSVAAAHHGKSGGHGKYYMYAEVPKKGAHKFGYKRGNHKHHIEGKESAHKKHVHGYVKWHDKKGKGSHKYVFEHSEHKKKKGY